MSEIREVIIIGGGPAGYTAALYAARATCATGLRGLRLRRPADDHDDVENYPGFVDGIMGPELMATMRSQAERFGAELVADDVTRVDFSERPFRVYLGDEEHLAKSVIVATGATARQIGLESETKLQGMGVSYCAVCDAPSSATSRSWWSAAATRRWRRRRSWPSSPTDVKLVHRRDDFRASKIMIDYAKSKPNLAFVTNSVVEEVLGESEGHVTGVRLRDTATGEVSELPADGLFVAIGHDPTTGLFKGILDMDEAGYLLTKTGSTETNIEGVFAAGDVVDHTYRQAVTAAGMGCMAALDAERWLSHASRPPSRRPPPRRPESVSNTRR